MRLLAGVTAHRLALCFLGTCSWTEGCPQEARTHQRFNPCFLGTCSWTWQRARYMICSTSVSILVFLELALGQDRAKKIAAGKWMFQSLFSWNLLLDPQATFIDAVGKNGFNPCFLGTCSWTLIEPQTDECVNEFQSLFSWNLLLDKSQSPREGHKMERFNPCFLGTCSWTKI
jgi:hypothetical protein